MTTIEFGEPVYVEALPPSTNKAGRASLTPAMQAWLAKVEVGKTAELPSKDEDGGHPVGRVSQMRKVAEGMPETFKIDTRPIVTGKRYRIFATHVAPEPANGKASPKR